MGRLLVVAIGLVLAAGGCATQPEPGRTLTVDPHDRGAADDALEAFFAAMANPDVTYRVTGHLQLLPLDENGQGAIDIHTRYDVKGDDYAGGVSLAGWDRDPMAGGNVHIVVLDGTAHVLAEGADRHVALAAPPSLRRPSALADLSPEDLELIGVGADGLFEFAVGPWLGGDPIGEWSDLGAVPAAVFPPTEVHSHRTRLFIDDWGIPRRLVTSWTFAAPGIAGEASGTISEEIEGLGMYVTLAEPEGPFTVSSHDVIVGVDGEHRAVVEPWYEVLPDAGATAGLEVEFEVAAEQPFILGIEGAIGFIRSLDEDRTLILDRIVNLSSDTDLEVSAGEQSLVVYYRTCSGNCSILDPPTDFCSVAADIAPGRRYRLLVEVHGREQATCSLAEAS